MKINYYIKSNTGVITKHNRVGRNDICPCNKNKNIAENINIVVWRKNLQLNTSYDII